MATNFCRSFVSTRSPKTCSARIVRLSSSYDKQRWVKGMQRAYVTTITSSVYLKRERGREGKRGKEREREVGRSVGRSVSQSVNQSISQSVNQPISQSFVRSFVFAFDYFFFICSLARSFARFRIRLLFFICSLTRSFVRSFSHSITDSFFRSLILSFD